MVQHIGCFFNQTFPFDISSTESDRFDYAMRSQDNDRRSIGVLDSK